MTSETRVDFKGWVNMCWENRELLEVYDKLRGTNLSQKGAGIEILIDRSCKRQESEIPDFVAFCWDLWTRIPIDPC